jgi:hypothetical protein
MDVSIHVVSRTPKLSVNVGRWWQVTGLIFDVLVLMLRLLIIKLLACRPNVMLRSWVFRNIAR